MGNVLVGQEQTIKHSAQLPITYDWTDLTAPRVHG